ncbi:MAG: CHAT domain-containing protein [Planctomycetaceae bacterium]
MACRTRQRRPGYLPVAELAPRRIPNPLLPTDSAEDPLKRAAAIQTRTLGSDDPATGVSLSNLGLLYDALGQHDQSEQLHRRALAIFEKAHGPDDPAVARSLNNLAAVFEAQGRDADRGALLARALAIRERSLGGDHPLTALSLNNMACFHEEHGRHGEARELHARALAIREKALGAGHPDTAQSLNNLAAVYLAQGDIGEAERLHRRSLEICERSLGADHPHTTLCLNNLVWLAGLRGAWTEAAALTDRARRGVRRHVSRVLPSLTAAEQATFLRVCDQPSLRLALWVGLLGREDRAINDMATGWLANGKAVAQEAASYRSILARRSDDPKTASLVRELGIVRSRLADSGQALAAVGHHGTDRVSLVDLQRDERRLIHAIGGQIAALDRDEPWVEIDAIRRSLPLESVFVDIACFDVPNAMGSVGNEDGLSPHYVAWISPPAGAGNVIVVPLGSAKEIDRAVEDYRKAMEAVATDMAQGLSRLRAEELQDAATRLSKRVLHPILAAVGPAKEVILSPDGALWLVPWQALPLPDGSLALEHAIFRTVTTGRDVVREKPDDVVEQGTAVVVGDPDFDAARRDTADPAATSPTRPAPTGPFTRLAGTRAEAFATRDAMARITGKEPTLLLGADASEARFRGEVSRPKAIMLATHGFFVPVPERTFGDDARSGRIGDEASARPPSPGEDRLVDDPLLRCGLALAGANGGRNGAKGDDGLLTGAEIVGLDLMGTELVVLSACETGVGDVQQGEGVAGLRQAFQIAGARSVVSTLWKVPDAASVSLMSIFYDRLATGLPASQSLREAQLHFLREARRSGSVGAHPYFWAAYGVTGN